MASDKRVGSLVKWSAFPLLALVAAACTSSNPTTTTDAGQAPCDDAKCVAGNKCINGYNSADDEKAAKTAAETIKCRIVCDLDPTNTSEVSASGKALIAPQDKCPVNTHCSPGGTAKADGSSVSYCVPNQASATFQPPPMGKGQWGASCDPSKGFDNNPGCDTDQNFWCYGVSNTDGSAICTQFQCQDDWDCAGGYTCTTINSAPSVLNIKRSFGQTTTVCLPRAWNLWEGSYCSSCKSDDDCPMNDGQPQHCVGADGQGGMEKICAVECGKDANCNLDAKCVTTTEGPKTCVPRAGTCKGDGTFCSPCHSDADCAAMNGWCYQPENTTERFCTVQSGKPCSLNAMMQIDAMCPKPPTGAAPIGESCFYSVVDGKLKDQCIGLVQFGPSTQNATIGCWTAARKM